MQEGVKSILIGFAGFTAVVLLASVVGFDTPGWTGSQTGGKGLILVEEPEVYTRERLVNDRYREATWLTKWLKKTDELEKDGRFSIPAGRLGAEVRKSTEGSVDISLSPVTNGVASTDERKLRSNGGDHKGRTAGEREPGQGSIGLTPIDLFRDLTAYREVVRAELLQTQLDDRHDIDGNTLYKLSFDTTVIPGADTNGWAVVTAAAEHRIESEDYRQLYLDWVKKTRKSVNKAYQAVEEAVRVSTGSPELTGEARKLLVFLTERSKRLYEEAPIPGFEFPQLANKFVEYFKLVKWTSRIIPYTEFYVDKLSENGVCPFDPKILQSKDVDALLEKAGKNDSPSQAIFRRITVDKVARFETACVKTDVTKTTWDELTKAREQFLAAVKPNLFEDGWLNFYHGRCAANDPSTKFYVTISDDTGRIEFLRRPFEEHKNLQPPTGRNPEARYVFQRAEKFTLNDEEIENELIGKYESFFGEIEKRIINKYYKDDKENTGFSKFQDEYENYLSKYMAYLSYKKYRSDKNEEGKTLLELGCPSQHGSYQGETGAEPIQIGIKFYEFLKKSEPVRKNEEYSHCLISLSLVNKINKFYGRLKQWQDPFKEGGQPNKRAKQSAQEKGSAGGREGDQAKKQADPCQDAVREDERQQSPVEGEQQRKRVNDPWKDMRRILHPNNLIEFRDHSYDYHKRVFADFLKAQYEDTSESRERLADYVELPLVGCDLGSCTLVVRPRITQGQRTRPSDDTERTNDHSKIAPDVLGRLCRTLETGTETFAYGVTPKSVAQRISVALAAHQDAKLIAGLTAALPGTGGSSARTVISKIQENSRQLEAIREQSLVVGFGDHNPADGFFHEGNVGVACARAIYAHVQRRIGLGADLFIRRIENLPASFADPESGKKVEKLREALTSLQEAMGKVQSIKLPDANGPTTEPWKKSWEKIDQNWGEVTSAWKAVETTWNSWPGGGDAGVRKDDLEAVARLFAQVRAAAKDSLRIAPPVHFGWSIGPRFGDGENDRGGRHVASHYSLSAIISVPSWWRRLHLTIRRCWRSPKELNGVNGLHASRSGETPLCRDDKQPQMFVVNLPGEEKEIPRKLGFEVLKFPRLDDSIMKEAEDPRERQTLVIGRRGQLLIRGERLWRSTSVTLGEQMTTDIVVLPDMEGIIARFDCVEPPARAHGSGGTVTQRAQVWTSEGRTDPFKVDLQWVKEDPGGPLRESCYVAKERAHREQSPLFKAARSEHSSENKRGDHNSEGNR